MSKAFLRANKNRKIKILAFTDCSPKSQRLLYSLNKVSRFRFEFVLTKIEATCQKKLIKALPDLILFDLYYQSQLNEKELYDVRFHYPNALILTLTAFEEEGKQKRVMQTANAKYTFIKHIPSQSLLELIQQSLQIYRQVATLETAEYRETTFSGYIKHQFNKLFTKETGQAARIEPTFLFANIDWLTGLPSKYAVSNELQVFVSKSAVLLSDQSAVFAIDLDSFRFVNESLGYKIGDCVLQKVAERLIANLPLDARVARYEADKFIVFLKSTHDKASVDMVANKVLQILREPMQFEGRVVFITASIGVVLTSIADDAQLLLHYSNQALKQVKQNGGNDYSLYTDESHDYEQFKGKITAYLPEAIQKRQFLLVTQAITNLHTNEVVAYEARLRWQSPELGEIAAEEFALAAEKMSLSNALTRFIIQEACILQQAAQGWGESSRPIALNFSIQDLLSTETGQFLEECLKQYALPPEALIIQVSFPAISNHFERIKPALEQLQVLGIRMMVDHFTASFSSLEYLEAIPIYALKIDPLFVKGIITDQDCREIIHAVLRFATQQQIQVIANGIDSLEILNASKAMGCQYGQGHYQKQIQLLQNPVLMTIEV